MIILGVDYGERRIGVAVSDELEIAAHGHDTIQSEGSGSEIEKFASLATELGAEMIVVGMPKRMDGSIGPAAHKVGGFIKRLRARLPEVPVETMDERLTTAEAHKALSTEGVTMRRRAQRVDRMAAQLILGRYLKLRQTRRRDEQRPDPDA